MIISKYEKKIFVTANLKKLEKISKIKCFNYII